MISWRPDLRGTTNIQQLRRQNFRSRCILLMEVFTGPAAQSRHHLPTVFTTTEGHLFRNQGHGALWLLLCSALEKHLLTYRTVVCLSDCVCVCVSTRHGSVYSLHCTSPSTKSQSVHAATRRITYLWCLLGQFLVWSRFCSFIFNRFRSDFWKKCDLYFSVDFSWLTFMNFWSLHNITIPEVLSSFVNKNRGCDNGGNNDL